MMTQDEIKNAISELMKNGKEIADRVNAAEAQVAADKPVIEQIKGAIQAYNSMLDQEEAGEDVKGKAAQKSGKKGSSEPVFDN